MNCIIRLAAKLLTGIVLISLLSLANAMAQDDDPLALENYLPGYDEEKSRQVLAQHFAGVWRVVHNEKDGQSWTGRAEVAADGSDISLVLTGPDGTEHYDFVGAQADQFAEGTGPFTGSLIARFQKGAAPVLNKDGEHIATATPFVIPEEQTLLSFKKDEFDLDLHVVWSSSEFRQIQVSLSARDNDDKYEGMWNEEKGDALVTRGLATWERGEPRVDGVLVVSNQLDPSAGANYPFTPDGAKIDHVSDKRTLVVYGQNLPDMADRADIKSLSEFVTYKPDYREGADRAGIIAAALKKAKGPDPDDVDAFILNAQLHAGVTPSIKDLSINGDNGRWPLLFANQMATFHFSRSGGEPTLVFYPGDVGYVELSFETEMPFEEIPIRILRGAVNPIEEAVLAARRLPDDDPLVIVYRTDPFHLYHRSNSTLSPPEDENILRIPAAGEMMLQAVLLDRAEALTIPPVAQAKVYDNPSQLGGLWKDALQRVARCDGDTIDDFETYQHEESARISKVIITERGSRNISLFNGDLAAAILIRDEFVAMSSPIMGSFVDQSLNVQKARAAMAAAQNNSAIAETRFWRDSKAEHVTERWLWNSTTEVPLIDALDVSAMAQRFEMTPEQATNWAEEQTMAASKLQAEKMQVAMSWAMDAGDCDIEELLLVAGHRSPPVIARIMPRLVKLQTNEGPPKRQHWVTDTTAQGFVKSLYVAGAAVRALENYSEIDSDVGVAIAAIATAGLSIGLEAAGYASAAMWANLAASAADLAYGLVGVQEYFESEDLYEYAQGAAPALGDEFLADAMADRKSPLMTAIGVLLPAAGGAANIKHIRNFKNVQKGRALMDTNPGALDDITALSDPERTALAGYFTDLAAKVKRSGLDKLDDADRAAFERFRDYFDNPGGSTPAPASPADAADPNITQPIAETGPGLDPNATDIIENPTMINDPRLGHSELSIDDVLTAQPIDDSPPLPMSEGALQDFAATEPGSLSNHLTAEEVEVLFEPGRNLTREEILQKVDLIRDGRVPVQYAQGDPEVLRALDRVFELDRNRPEVTGGGTIIEPGSAGASQLPDTVLEPGPTGASQLPETVMEPGPATGSTLPETITDPGTGPNANADPNATLPPSAADPNGPLIGVDERLGDEFANALDTNPAPSGVDPDATVPPSGADPDATMPPPVPSGTLPITGEDEIGTIITNIDLEAPLPSTPVDPGHVPHDGLAGQLARLEEEAASAVRNGDVPEFNNDVGNLGLARRSLAKGTPEQLEAASRLDQNMRTLGVPDIESVRYTALFYQRGDDAISGFGPKMVEAQTIAEGIFDFGRRPVSLAEFAEVNGLSPTAARAAIEQAAVAKGAIYNGSDIVPIPFTR